VSTLVDVERSGESGSWDAICRACPWERRDLISEVLAVELAVEHESECPRFLGFAIERALANEPGPLDEIDELDS
jgi:hypothetical protein